VIKLKKILVTVLTGLLCLSIIAGCSSKQSNDSKETTKPAQEEVKKDKKLKVGLLLAGTINDNGFNAVAYNALNAVRDEYGAEVAYTESVTQSDMEEGFRNYATQGYDIIFAHGFEFSDAAKKVASEFPDVKFIVNSSEISAGSNLASIKVDNIQIGFIEGVVAAAVSKTNVVAAIGGMNIPPIVEDLTGYELGAKYINPKIQVLSAMTGSFDDVGKVKETALAMIEKKADVVMVVADKAGIGGIEAAKEKGVMAINNNFDGYEFAPDTVVVSGLADFNVCFKFIAKQVIDGKFEAKNYRLGVAEGVIYLSPFHNFEQKLPKETLQKINSIVEDIKTGKIDVHNLPK
jgi:basic membrane protein A